MKTLLLIWSLVIGHCLAGPGFFMNQQGVVGASAAPDNTPPVTSGLIFFAEAGQESYGNGDAVSTITDLSGSGFNATQGTAASRPTFLTNIVNGRSGYRFDGVNDFAEFSGLGLDLFRNRTGYSVYIISSATSVAATAKALLYSCTSSSTANARFLIRWGSFGGTQNGVMLYRASDGGGYTTLNGATTPTVSQAYLLTGIVDFTGSTSDLFVDGASSDASGATPAGASTDNTSSLAINIGRSTAAGQYLPGDIACMLVYTSAHDSTTRDSIRNWLIARYSL